VISTGSRWAEVAAALPIGEVLDAIAEHLSRRDELVLEAPPGAGKTTIVPLALLAAPWLAGRNIIMLQPRRVAARAAAVRMAELLGEAVGQTVGYRVRLDSRVSAATRIEVITEGVLGRLLLDDPALSTVGLLIFDEFHERSLDADLGLALVLQGRELFREGTDPLKLLVMSATLDGDAVSALLGQAPQLRSQGRMFPVAVHYAGSYSPGASIVAPVVDLLWQQVLAPEPLEAMRASVTTRGGVLVFLPGQREINQVSRSLDARLSSLPEERRASVVVVSLHGGLSLEAQQRALAPALPGQCKLVLATNIAETSLTIPGVATVVDSGLAREPRFDPRTGVTRLQTTRISRDASIQRMGRAGRRGPGRCFRLWRESQQAQLAAHRVPEIMQADLLPLTLQLLSWGVDEPGELRWLDQPPPGAFAQAVAFLAALGALVPGVSGSHRLSAHGEAMAQLPMHPRLAHMVLCAAPIGLGDLACDLAALLAERDPTPGRDADIAARLKRLHDDKHSGAAQLAWRKRVRRQSQAFRRQYRALVKGGAEPVGSPPVVDRVDAPGALLAWAYADRVARCREPGGTVYQLANGRAAALAEGDMLRNHEWLVVTDAGGQVGQVQDRIYAATALAPHFLVDACDAGLLSGLVCWQEAAHWDEGAGRFIAERQAKLGVLVLSREPLLEVPLGAKRQALLSLVARRGLQLLPWTDALRQWQGRVLLLRAHGLEREGEVNPWPDVSDQALLSDLGRWLGPALDPVQRLQDFGQLDLAALLAAMLPWPLSRQLDEWAPTHWQVPTGSRVAIDYRHDPPVMAVKLQEMFGCTQGPVVARGRVSVMLHLLSPARRPLQITTDLAGFWVGSYHAVKKEMKGRYPKHPWPDDPCSAQPTRYTRHRPKR
jgi:ATP-dependent helicase HrpB